MSEDQMTPEPVNEPENGSQAPEPTGGAESVEASPFAADAAPAPHTRPDVPAALADAAASALVGTDAILAADISREIIGQALAASFLPALGVTTRALTVPKLVLPKFTAMDAPVERNEYDPIPSGQGAIGTATIATKNYGRMFRLSRETLDDLPNLGAAMQAEIVRVASVFVAAKVLEGLKAQTFPATVATGTRPVPIELVRAKYAVTGRHYAGVKMLYGEVTDLAHAEILDTQGNPARFPDAFTNTQRVVTSHITDGTAFVGDFSRAVLGWRDLISLRVLDQTFAETNEVGFALTLRMAFGVTHVDAFQRVNPKP